MHYLNINPKVIKCVSLLTKSIIRKYYTHLICGLLWIARVRQLKYIGRKVNDKISNYINTCVFHRWKTKTSNIVNRGIIQIQKYIQKHHRDKTIHTHKLQNTTEMIMIITLRKYLRKCYSIK